MNALAIVLAAAIILPEFDIVREAKRAAVLPADSPRGLVAARPLTTAQAVALSRDPEPVRSAQTIQAAPVQQRTFVRRRGFFRRR